MRLNTLIPFYEPMSRKESFKCDTFQTSIFTTSEQFPKLLALKMQMKFTTKTVNINDSARFLLLNIYNTEQSQKFDI